MAEPQVERRLAAILCADVVGYSRLIAHDEAGTIGALKSLRRGVVDPLLVRHHGRLVQTTGDGALVEFASVVDAVLCAAALQEAVAQGQVEVPPERRLVLRIGINLGEVVADGSDILGDGVNVAARLEQLCEPGGVLVSETVREHVGNRIDLVFDDIGLQTLKNIERPIRAHRLRSAGEQSALAAILGGPSRDRRQRSKPSIAVLPFENLSRDPDQDYFSEGIAEDLITDLSKISGLQVVGRRSILATRDSTRDAMEISTRLQVGHILDGSIRRAGNRIRITARLVDGATGTQVWADRYDRTLDDIFAVQDDITHQIVVALQIRLPPTEKQALERPPTSSIEAYGDYLRGLKLLARHIKPSYELARRMFMRAVSVDPDFARALAGIAECDCHLYLHFGGPSSFDDVLAVTARALELEPGLASAHAARGTALSAVGRADEAERSFRRAIESEPDHVAAHYFYGRACVEWGRLHEAVQLLQRAVDLVPDDVGYISALAGIYMAIDMRSEAETTAREMLTRCERELAQDPELTVAAWAGGNALARLGEHARAVEWTQRALAIEPDDNQTLYNAACNYALLGITDEAIGFLERAMPGASAHRIAWMQRDSDLDSLRQHPRYAALMLRLGAQA